MEYSFNYGGEVVVLPQYSFNIATKLETQEEINMSNKRFKEKCRCMYETISSILGSEKTKQLIGEFNDTECDPNELNVVYLLITRAYAEPVESFNNDELSNKLSSFDIDKVIKLIETAEKASKVKL